MAGLKYRKLVRNAVFAVLSNPASGVNARISSAAVEYGQPAFTIAFDGPQFSQCHIQPDQVELGPLLAFPALCLFTNAAADTGLARGIRFTGQVEAGIIGIIDNHSGAETTDTESIIDLYEDAVMSAMNEARWPVAITFTRETAIDRPAILPLADGWRQWFDIRAQFLVSIP